MSVTQTHPLPSKANPGVENAGLLPLTRYGEVYALPSQDLAIGSLHALTALQVVSTLFDTENPAT